MPFIAPEPVSQKPVAGSQHVLKAGDAFVVSDTLGDILGHDDGLFVADMRVLSGWRLTFGGRAPSLLSGATSADNASFTAHLTNRPLPPLGGHEMPEGVIHIDRTRVLADNVLYEALTLTNYGTADAEVPLSISFAADFLDMFEVRGTPRERRAAVAAPEVEAGQVRLRYDGLDGVARAVRIGFSPAPVRLDTDRADYTLTIAAQACVSIYLTVEARIERAGEPAAPPQPLAQAGRPGLRRALVQVHRQMRERSRTIARVRTGNPLFNAWLDRSLADLGLLTTQLETGPYPYAGIPWFSTPFGRDAVITSLQMLWLQPSLARGVLRFLAAHQAQETSAFRDGEPGKIMHEFRRSEMAATGEVPFALVEVQAYASAAFDAMATFSTHRGDAARAADYSARASKLREAVEQHFWMPEAGFYGIALDGRGELCRVLASNAGHLLAFGLPEASCGEAVARTLDSSLFRTGWGVRTLAAGQPRFNPMAYHNGSVWPHDNALAARGFARYGNKTAATELLRALFEAAVSFDMRLPELFCGFPRRRGEPPTGLSGGLPGRERRRGARRGADRAPRAAGRHRLTRTRRPAGGRGEDIADFPPRRRAGGGGRAGRRPRQGGGRALARAVGWRTSRRFFAGGPPAASVPAGWPAGTQGDAAGTAGPAAAEESEIMTQHPTPDEGRQSQLEQMEAAVGHLPDSVSSQSIAAGAAKGLAFRLVETLGALIGDPDLPEHARSGYEALRDKVNDLMAAPERP